MAPRSPDTSGGCTRAISNSSNPAALSCEEAGISAIYAEPRSAAYEEMRDLSLAAGKAAAWITTGAVVIHLWARKPVWNWCMSGPIIPITSMVRTGASGVGPCASPASAWSKKLAPGRALGSSRRRDG